MSLLLLSSALKPSGVGAYVKRVLLTGGAIVVPVVLTVYITAVIVDFLSQFLAPGVFVVQDSLGVTSVPVVVIELTTAAVFLVVIFLIGVVAESKRTTGTIEQRFESAVTAIPGVGSIYANLNEISELLIQQDTESFQEVKLVEFPQEDSYVLGFVTADEPRRLEAATGHDEMTTLFAPLGPNPFMGGFVLHVPDARVHEIEMSVEEGIQTIVSSGVVLNDPDAATDLGEDR